MMFLIASLLAIGLALGLYLLLRPRDDGNRAGPHNNWQNEEYSKYDAKGRLRISKFSKPYDRFGDDR